MKNRPLRYCKDLGMWALDRGVSSCRWRTRFCAEHCYNLKLYKAYGGMYGRDRWLDWAVWSCSPDLFAQVVATDVRSHRDVTRIRLCTRGESFSTMADVARVEALANAIPDVKIWVPTRSWRGNLRHAVKAMADRCPNVQLQASVDPSNGADEVRALVREGWSLMFFGDDTNPPGDLELSPGAVRLPVIKCEKTWEHAKSACAGCKRGCFHIAPRLIWLKQHD